MARSGRAGRAPLGAQAAVRAALLPLVAALVVVAAVARRQGDVDAASDVYLGAMLGFGLIMASGLATFPLAMLADAEIPLVLIGVGPIVRRHVGRHRMTVLRLLPVSFFYVFGARRAHFRRDTRLLAAANVVTPPVAALALVTVLPGYVALAAVLTAGWSCLVRLAQRNPVLECSNFAFLVRSSTPDDRGLNAAADSWDAFYAAAFGDAATAERRLPGVPARVAAPMYGAAPLQGLLHEIRGDYEAAWRLLRSYPPEHARVARLDDVRLRLLEAERNPSTRDSALAAADRLLGTAQQGRQPQADRGRYSAVLALYRLELGRPNEARGSVQVQLRLARTPVRYAEALCNRARIEAAAGRLEQAGRTLRLAHSVAPWHARIGVVRGRIGLAAADGAPVRDVLEITRSGAADTPADPWAAPGA